MTKKERKQEEIYKKQILNIFLIDHSVQDFLSNFIWSSSHLWIFLFLLQVRSLEFYRMFKLKQSLLSNITNWDDMKRNVAIINEAGEPGFKVENYL